MRPEDPGREGERARLRGRSEAALEQELAELGPAELFERLEELGVELSAPLARVALRNPHVDERALELLCERRDLLQDLGVRSALAAHPRTPVARALRLLPQLPWRPLARLAAQVRTPPRVRRSAEKWLAERWPALSLGERIALARIAPRGLLADWSRDAERPVFRAILDNPRMVEGILVAVAQRASTSPEILRQLAAHRRFGRRYGVRLAICRNPQAPFDLVRGLLRGLSRPHLRSLSRDPRTPRPVRRAADRALGA